MINIKKHIILLILSLFSLAGVGQQTPQFSQRMIDMYQYNPAFVGSKVYSEFMWHNRSQWKGFEGAPKTSSFTFHTRLNRLMGFGISFFKDQIGPQKTVGLKIAYAHHIEMERINLAFGLTGDILQYGLDGNLITIQETNDDAINLEVFDKKWRPDATFGALLYNESFYFGFSMMNMLGSTVELFTEEGQQGNIDLVRHYYVNGGYSFSPIRNFDFDPSILWVMARGTPAQFDINLNVQYLGKLLVGFSYRMKDAMVLVAGVKVKDHLKIAYSYDIVTSPLKAYNSGSHEIIMSFIIPSKKGKWNRWKHEYQYNFNPKTNKWKERW
ncbi:MAG: type IX secretion system membrane protein PorP/SprF [Bacteroidales bacterium]|nr:type IX secretion system membrane protein PorP/SprF [Bacteroidales bacterium]MCF8455621.1 type IX secretion system membrane protein PorP/SprF [Bacteroidales bacterium]